jgi:N-acetylglucosamine-6-phosphate deacetylase
VSPASAPALVVGLLGRDDLGRLEPGGPAHITVLDDGLRVLRTLVSGREALSASA